jgi:hypothetical protein
LILGGRTGRGGKFGPKAQDRLVRSFIGILLVSLEVVKKDESFLDGHLSSRR